VHAQVILRLNSLHSNSYDPIKVTVINQESRTISACMSEEWIQKPNDDVGVAMTPFVTQVKSGRKWRTLLNGVDVGGPLRSSITIEPRHSEEFQLQMKGNSRARLVLYYWIGGNISACDNPRGRKVAMSATFTLAAHEEQ
jgi:hypothetical protein